MSITDRIELAKKVHELIGCEWGWKVALDGDREPCLTPAAQRVALHNGAKQYDLKLCSRHLSVIEAHTDPHQEHHGKRPESHADGLNPPAGTSGGGA